MRLPDPDRSRAVLIGTRSYSATSGLPELPGVTGNVRGMAGALADIGMGGGDRCVVMVDPADDRRVCREVRRVAGEAEDLLLIYFAGHGLLAPELNFELFLALSDSDQHDPLYSAIRFSEIAEAITASPARNRVLILDCCYSGRALSGTMSSSASDIAGAQTEITGTYTLTATSANMLARAPVGQDYTLFTGALLEAVREGLPNGQPYVTLNELYRHLSLVLEPRPRQQGTDTAGHLALARNPSYEPPPTSSVPPRPPDTRETESVDDAAVFTADRPRMWARGATGHLLSAVPAVAVMVFVGALVDTTGSYNSMVLLLITIPVLLVSMILVRYSWFATPDPYTLHVDGTGLRLAHGDSESRVSWQEIEQVTTLRSHRGRASPDQLVIRPRRGFVAPRRRASGPRMDARRHLLVFCELGRLAASSAEVEQAVAARAPGLWDDTHGLYEASRTRFDTQRRHRRLAALATVVPCVALAWLMASGGALDGDAGHGVGIGTALVLAMTIGASVVLLALRLLPYHLEVDDRGLRMRVRSRHIELRWDEIVELSRPEKLDTVLHVRPVDPSRLVGPGFDKSTGVFVFDLSAVAATDRELDVVFRRFAGARWKGVVPDTPAPSAHAYSGRLWGPRSVIATSVLAIAAYAALIGFDLLDGSIDMLDTIIWAGGCCALVALGIGGVLREQCVLLFDSHGMEFAAGRRKVRVPWNDLSGVGIVMRKSEYIDDQALVIWFKDRAHIPPRWPWRRVFIENAGGLRVVALSPLHGVRADRSAIEAELAEFARPIHRPSS
ncbi:caspase, EACC1-associated type [Nocardia abscessus]|uniref:caspase, EACC1-associated type n=1 Tax=Nocardia abscessus TaxID=120957 RepID=UPI002455D53C|nr:caspase family protein [Nocardia abscessus]